MAGRASFTNVDKETAADMRRRGLDPHELDLSTEQLLTYICAELIPGMPVSDRRQHIPIGNIVSRLVACATRNPAYPASDGVDRISLLPKASLHNIVSRLPVKDAARTAVLSSRWRRVWRSSTLVLNDRQLRPKGCGWPPTPADSPSITAAVSSILQHHAGPFASVSLTCSHMNAYQAQLARWLELLAAKGVHELVLVNRPWPLEVPLPATLFRFTTLTRLYLGLWKFPDVASLPRRASFPHLRELGLCNLLMEDGDIHVLIAKSPLLEILNIHGSNKGLHLRLVSQSLRCVQICGSVVEEITLLKTPRLDRLILERCRSNSNVGDLCTRIKIDDAPMLRVFGIFDPGNHILKIRDTVIMVGMKESPSTIITSIKILSLNVCLGNHNIAKILPTILGCFPNLEALHIMSVKCDYQAGSARENLKFWQLAKPAECIKSCITVFSFREFRGEIGEVAFLKFLFRGARALKTAAIIMANPSFTSFSMHEAQSKFNQACEKMANKSCEIMFLGSKGPEGGRPWSFKKGSDYLLQDPFWEV